MPLRRGPPPSSSLKQTCERERDGASEDGWRAVWPRPGRSASQTGRKAAARSPGDPWARAGPRQWALSRAARVRAALNGCSSRCPIKESGQVGEGGGGDLKARRALVTCVCPAGQRRGGPTSPGGREAARQHGRRGHPPRRFRRWIVGCFTSGPLGLLWEGTGLWTLCVGKCPWADVRKRPPLALWGEGVTGRQRLTPFARCTSCLLNCVRAADTDGPSSSAAAEAAARRPFGRALPRNDPRSLTKRAPWFYKFRGQLGHKGDNFTDL